MLKKVPTLWHAVLPLATLVCLLFLNVAMLGSEATNGANQTAMLLAATVATLIAFRLGYTWDEIETGIIKSITSSLGAILILMMIGALSGTWLLSGVVPAMIYYGLYVLSPTYFLVAACIVSGIVSLATGSSWSTVATVGVALLAIGKTLGISEPIIAGAIISGSYFGDKMSPLSDTTNMAPAMAGTNLFTHIRYMTITTVPTLIVALLIYFVWGFTFSTHTGMEQVAVQQALSDMFNLSPILFVAPLLVIFLIIKKTPALPAIFVGALVGAILAVIFQPQIIRHVVADGNFSYTKASFIAIIKSMSGTISISTANPMLSSLLTTNGMYGMMNTIWLVTCAMVFGGVMESCGLLQFVAEKIIRMAHSAGSLVASTVATCVFFNLTASDQYMSITVPGRMFADAYKKKGYKPELLSRSLEDSGTVTSVLIPWNTCGATQSKVLGVSTWAYAPYAFFCIISPLMSILIAYLNIKIRRYDEKPT